MIITVINYEIHVTEVEETACNDADYFQFERKIKEDTR